MIYTIKQVSISLYKNNIHLTKLVRVSTCFDSFYHSNNHFSTRVQQTSNPDVSRLTYRYIRCYTSESKQATDPSKRKQNFHRPNLCTYLASLFASTSEHLFTFQHSHLSFITSRNAHHVDARCRSRRKEKGSCEKAVVNREEKSNLDSLTATIKSWTLQRRSWTNERENSAKEDDALYVHTA